MIQEQIVPKKEQMFPCEQGEQKRRKSEQIWDILRFKEINWINQIITLNSEK